MYFGCYLRYTPKAEACETGVLTLRSSGLLARIRSPRTLHGNETDPGGRVKVGELIRLLEEDGWRLARTRGSHRQYKHPSKPGAVTVAGKPSLDVPPGTLNAILKQAGLKKEK